MWFKNLSNWSTGVWKGLEILANENIDQYMQNLRDESDLNSEDQNFDRNVDAKVRFRKFQLGIRN